MIYKEKLGASFGVPPQLVGAERCINLIFPDPEARPAKRTFLDWQAKGHFRFHKIGRSTFYDPFEIAEDLRTRFCVGTKTPTSSEK